MASKDSNKFEEILKSVGSLFSVKSLKKEQENILNELIAKKNCMAVLPTGYGKSLPYQMYIPLIRELTNRKSELDETLEIKIERLDPEEKVIVCCPLVALMEDQVTRLQGIEGLRVAYKGK